MDREVDTGKAPDQKRGKASKAKLDSKGRPIAVKAPETNEREDGSQPVRVAVRLGVLLCALTTQSGCEPAATEPAPLDPRIERAVADARAAADEAKQHAQLAHMASQSVAASIDSTKAQAELEAAQKGAQSR